MEAERPVAKRRTHNPTANLTQACIAKQQSRFPRRLPALGCPSGEIGDHAARGQGVDHGHEREDLDQSEARERELLGERHVHQRRPVERQTAICQQQHSRVREVARFV